jgi:hypothetical protein
MRARATWPPSLRVSARVSESAVRRESACPTHTLHSFFCVFFSYNHDQRESGSERPFSFASFLIFSFEALGTISTVR